MQLAILEDAASLPCAASAISSLKAGCRDMGEEQQARLAVALTNCHLLKSGLDTARMRLQQVCIDIIKSAKGGGTSPASSALHASQALIMSLLGICPAQEIMRPALLYEPAS